ncbi:MAG TPA: hypothetical protein PKL78_02035, partial [Anaerolineales bacterium]|nr:hypothetical protein [Anaerolineales bacterium]
MAAGALILAGTILASCAGSATLPPFATPLPSPTPPPLPTATIEPFHAVDADASLPSDAAKAVDLIAAWVDGGAPETDEFDFTAEDGTNCNGTFAEDVQPLFTTNGVWFEGSQACSGCHFANSENSYHEMDLSSYQGIMTGPDPISAPPGESILGESEFHAGDFNWDESLLKARLMNNRMPPGWAFDLTETNRSGQCVEVSADGVNVLVGQFADCELNGTGLIEAWVTAGAPETDAFEYGSQQLTFERDVLPFFTKPNMWYEGSQACSGCHFANSENSYHEMDLSSYQGIMTGPDPISAPPGESILGESEFHAGDFNWDESLLKARLMNNRMPPGSPFDITEANRSGPLVLHGVRLETKSTGPTFGTGECEIKAVDLIAAWVDGGAPETDEFDFTAEDGTNCNGTFAEDVQPLFTTNGVWFEGSQACSGCHFANSENSYHEMDLSSYQGIMTGPDPISAPPGESILGESEFHAGDFNW